MPSMCEDWFNLSIPSRGVLKATLVYYARSVVYILIIFGFLEAFRSSSSKTVSVLRAIWVYMIFLIGLFVVYKISPRWFDNVRWFCTPGNIFLKSWTSLFFYAYLIKLPVQLRNERPVQIVSFFSQVLLGNFLGTGIVGGIMMVILSVQNWLHNKTMNKEVDAHVDIIMQFGISIKSNSSSKSSKNPLILAAAAASSSSSAKGGGGGDQGGTETMGDDVEDFYPSDSQKEELMVIHKSRKGSMEGEEDEDVEEIGRNSVGSMHAMSAKIVLQLQAIGVTNTTDSTMRSLQPLTEMGDVHSGKDDGEDEHMHTITDDHSIVLSVYNTRRKSSISLADVSQLQSEVKRKRKLQNMVQSILAVNRKSKVKGKGTAASEAMENGKSGGGGGGYIGGSSDPASNTISNHKPFASGSNRPLSLQEIQLGSVARNSITNSRLFIGGNHRSSSIYGSSSSSGSSARPESGAFDSTSRQSIIEEARKEEVEEEYDESCPPTAHSSVSRSSMESNTSNRITTASLKEVSLVASQLMNKERESILFDSLPLIPSMGQIFRFWVFVAFLVPFISFSLPVKTQATVVIFQFAVSIAVYIFVTIYRKFLGFDHPVPKTLFPGVAMFAPTVMCVVILTSVQGVANPYGGLNQYQVGSPESLPFSAWGAGDFLTILLNASIVSLAFGTFDALISFSQILPLIVPVVVASCIVLYVFFALMSRAMQTPSEFALPLLTRSVTTPIAIAIGGLTGANPGLVAASTIINGVISLRICKWLLNKYRIPNPVARGVSAGVLGMLLGIVRLEKGGEQIAAGIGMAAYGVATISYAALMALSAFRHFIVELA